MKCSIVYVAAFLSGSALGAIGGGYEYGDHSSSTVALGSTTVSEVISTEINSPIGVSEVVSEGTTRVSVTLISSVTETANGVPGTATYREKQSETVSSSVVSQTTAFVGSTASSKSSASSSVVVSTETNEAVTGSATSSGLSPEVDSTVRSTTTVVQTTGLPTLTRSVSSVSWTSIAMDSQPIPVTSTQTSDSVTTLPQSTVVATDVVETSTVVSSQITSESNISTVTFEEVKIPSAVSTSVSTYTFVVTGATQTRTTTVTLKLPSKALSSSTAIECRPKTVYVTISNSRIAEHPISDPPLTLYKSSSSATKTLTSAPYSMVNSTQLNSGIGATGVPQYLHGTASATGTGGLTLTSAVNPAQPTFTGDAVNLLNHNYALLAEIAAALAALFGHCALI